MPGKGGRKKTSAKNNTSEVNVALSKGSIEKFLSPCKLQLDHADDGASSGKFSFNGFYKVTPVKLSPSSFNSTENPYELRSSPNKTTNCHEIASRSGSRTPTKRSGTTLHSRDSSPRILSSPPKVPLVDMKPPRAPPAGTSNAQSIATGKPRRRSRSKPELPSSRKLTEFFPAVRKSVRRPASEVRKEQQQRLEEAVLAGQEDGLEVYVDKIKGRSVRTTKEFCHGQFVVEYRGDLIDRETAQKREQLYAADPNIGCYMYYFKFKDKHYCVDATAETGFLGRLINHSNRPNLRTKAIEIQGKPHLIFVVSKNTGLCVGETLAYDYSDRDPETIAAFPWLVST